ncbi:MAG: alanine racemase [Ignavibacteria bacterium]|jgi:alanine racemase|nr:alanine racemase [Ignavibacteria bacterium]
MAITIAEINTRNLRHNLQMVRQQVGNIPILAMVKANGYGHSVIDVSRIFRTEKVEYLGVALITEAKLLRDNGDNGKILVMVSPEPTDADTFIDSNIETAFSSFDIVQAFEQRARERDAVITGHLYVDTGMHRDGFPPKDALAVMDYVKDKPNINVVGLMTHLATSDSPEIDFADKQLSAFEKVRSSLENAGFHFKYIHAANSAGIANYPKAHYSMVRPGISLYGMMPTKQLANKLNLKPVMTLKSRVMLVLNVPKGDFIGYSQTYTAQRDMVIAVVPMGYADGLPRNLSNRFQVLINGTRYNSVGSICMDEFMVDITDSDVKRGDEVVIFGKQGNEEIDVYELAELSYSIPYERTAAISQRVNREFIYESHRITNSKFNITHIM